MTEAGRPRKKARQLGDIAGNPPRLVLAEQLPDRSLL
jgi:hypothetical protein